MKKKGKDLIDINTKDIDEDIDNLINGFDKTKIRPFLKLFTFLFLFLFYIYISIASKNYAFRVIFMVFGLIFIVLIFQCYIVGSSKTKKKNELLKS